MVDFILYVVVAVIVGGIIRKIVAGADASVRIASHLETPRTDYVQEGEQFDLEPRSSPEVNQAMLKSNTNDPYKLSLPYERTLYVDAENMMYSISDYSDGFIPSWTSFEYKYRFKDSGLEIKLVNHGTEDAAGKIENIVIDGAVILSAIKTEQMKSQIVSEERFESRVKRLQDEVEWHQLENGPIKFFILSKYPDFISTLDLKGKIRTELERIKYGIIRFQEAIKKHSLDLHESEGGLKFDFEEVKRNEAVRNSVDKFESLFNLAFHEMLNFKIETSVYYFWLNEVANFDWITLRPEMESMNIAKAGKKSLLG